MAARDILCERELKEAREREADYRARLARHRELSLRLRSHGASLREALRGISVGPLTVPRLLTDVARLSSQALGIPRASIWLFDERREYLECRVQLPASEGEMRIATASCPRYIAAISQADGSPVAVSDAAQDPRTSELTAYLETHNVGAMLDIPIIGPGSLQGVVCHEHQGGSRIWQEEEIDFAADVGAMVALALEVERRFTAERAASGTEAKYQNLVESLPVTVYSFQAKTGELDYLSPRVKELGGLPAEQYLVSGGVERWVEAVEPEDREPVRKRLSGHIEDGIAEELIYRIRLPDGQRRWVRDNCTIVRDANGKPFAVQGTLADITALREAELARAEVERRYRTLLENVDLLAVMLDTTGHVEFVNECFLRTTGFSREEVLGADAFDLALPAGEGGQVRVDFLKGMRRGALAPRFESTIRTRTGGHRRILWTNTVVRSSAGAVVGSSNLGVDITERVEAELSHLEGQKLESLGRLAATVAHDFNNLLTVIANAGVTLGEREDVTAAELAAARSEINAAVVQATGLTRSLLAYARHEAIAPTLLSVDDLVRGILPVLQTLANPGLELAYDLDVPRARVVIDGTQLRQLVINLVSNAADATRGYGRHIRVSTSLVVLEADQARAKGLIAEGTFLVLTVADDGRGIASDLVDRVFDPFFTTKGKGEGTGLGLAMCASIVRRAGGFISVETQALEGATFRVHLPVARLEPTRTERALPGLTSRSDTPLVLVVEDNEPLRNLVARVLSGRGLRVLEVATAAAARALLLENRVDLLLTDGALPDGDGRELAAEATTRRLVRRVVLMSGAADGVGHAIDAIVEKPFRPDALVATVLRLLEADAHADAPEPAVDEHPAE